MTKVVSEIKQERETIKTGILILKKHNNNIFMKSEQFEKKSLSFLNGIDKFAKSCAMGNTKSSLRKINNLEKKKFNI